MIVWKIFIDFPPTVLGLAGLGDIARGAELLGVEISELITDTIMGMREVAEEIGLKGSA